MSPDGSLKRRSHHHHHNEHHSPAATNSTDNNGADYVMSAMLSEIKKLQQSVSDLTGLCKKQDKKNDDLNGQLEKLNKAHCDLRREQTDNLSDVLEKICEHVELVIGRMNDNLRKDVKKIVEASLNDNAVSLQATMEQTNSRVVETVKSVLTQVLVPSVDQICTQLFHQLNENFRDGLQEFLEQMKQETEIQVRPASPPDYTVQTQMIEGGMCLLSNY